LKIGHTVAMRLDHISYVTTHDQLSDTVQRIGARIGSAFIDGGIHPRFGTRNFIAPLINGQYIEVVCPLDHPATEHTPWGRAVTQKSIEGGGWFTWVFNVENLSQIEAKFGRSAIEGHRRLPDGSDLKWRQIGVKEIAEHPEFPFFIQWLSPEHPAQSGKPMAEIQKIVIADADRLEDSWFSKEILNSLGKVEIEWAHPSSHENASGIVAVELITPTGIVVLD